MTVPFRWFGKPVQIVRQIPGHGPRQWRTLLLQSPAGALVRAGTDIRPGDRVHEVTIFGKLRPDDYRTVARVDWESQKPDRVGVLYWVGGAPRPTSEGGTMHFDIETEAIRLLDWLADKPHQTSTLIEPFLTGRDLPAEHMWHLRDHLRDNGYVVGEASAGPVELTITAAGLAYITKVRSRRSDPAERTRTLRKGMLNWLYALSRANPPDDWTGFTNDPRFSMLGEQFTFDEVIQEAEYLSDHGLIAGHDIEEAGPASLYPRLTSQGRDCVTDYEGNVSEYLNRKQSRGDMNVYMAGVQGNTAIGSHHVVQNTSGVFDMQPLRDLADYVREVAPVLRLADDDRDRLTATAEELHATASADQPEPGKLRRLLDALMKGLIKAAPTIASSTAIDMVEEGRKLLGG